MNWKLLLYTFTALCLVGCGARGVHQREVYETPDYKWDRITSVDKNGENVDCVWVDPRSRYDFPVIEGPGEIARIWMTYHQPEGRSYEGVSLEIYWDDESEPSVRAPLGDFFGLGNGEFYEHENEFLLVSKIHSLNCFFPMPFRKSARFAVVNDTDKLVSNLYYYVEYKKFDSAKSLRGSKYFHAQYNQAKPTPQNELYTILDVKGSGVFLGSNLAIGLNTPGWWGEGDDIFTIDGETTYGTGSEDYYGGAWGWADSTAEGDRMGVSQADQPISREGEWNVYRFHSEAPLRFDEEFKFEIETGGQGFDNRAVIGNNYASVAYYYLDEPQGQPPLPSVEEREKGVYPLPDFRIGEWMEAETSLADGKLISVMGGTSNLRSFRRTEQELWSGDAVAVLIAYKTGARMAWSLNFPEAGTFKPTLRYSEGPSNFDFDLYMNGKLWKPETETFAKELGPIEEVLPSITVDRGLNIIEVVSTGTHPDAEPPAIFLDFDAIKFDPIEDAGALDMRVRPAEPTEDETVLHLVRVTPDEMNPAEAVIVDEGVADEEPVMQGVDSAQVVDGPYEGVWGLPFDGINDRLYLGAENFDQIGRKFDLSFWVYPAEDNERMYIFSRRFGLASIYDKGKIVFWVRDVDFRFFYFDTMIPTVPAGSWTHVRGTLDETIGRIYINGALVREADMVDFGEVNMFPGSSMIGGTGDINRSLKGAIADFRLKIGGF